MDIQFQELTTDCGTCGGAGKIREVPRVGDSYGQHPVSFEPPDCPSCNGSGKVLTEVGLAIVHACERLRRERVVV
jgi:DnaJ-class molecular chaperone